MTSKLVVGRFQSPFSGVFNSNSEKVRLTISTAVSFNLHFQESSILTEEFQPLRMEYKVIFQSPFSGVFNSNVLCQVDQGQAMQAFNLHFQESSILTSQYYDHDHLFYGLSISIFRSLQF